LGSFEEAGRERHDMTNREALLKDGFVPVAPAMPRRAGQPLPVRSFGVDMEKALRQKQETDVFWATIFSESAQN
jgi:hypothetical protein